MLLEELQTVFDGLIKQHGIDLRINEVPTTVKSPIALDVEHDESGNFVGVGFTSDGVVVYYFSDLLLLSSIDFSTVSLICHNGVSDFECLRQWGIGVSDNQLFWDTMLIGHIIDSAEKGYGLKNMAERKLNFVYPSYDDICGKKTLKQTKERRLLDQQPTKLVAMYNSCDCVATWRLYEQQIKGQGAVTNILETPVVRYFAELESPLAFILNSMESRGICVDLKYLASLKQELEAQKQPIEAAIKNELGNINLNSPKQLLEALNAKGINATWKGKSSTDKRALEKFREVPIVRDLLRYGELETLLSSFVSSYLERKEGIVHPWFNQCGTRTGRLSCSNPNLLQIPKRTDNGKLVRRMFIPRSGMVFGDCDFGQVEPRVLAHLSKDPVLCKMFNDGIDFHEFTAQRLNISRDRAKVLNLSVGYRATKYSVQRQLGGTLEEAQTQIDKWWGLFPTLRRWQDTIIWDAKRSGFCTTLLGLRIKVEGLHDSNFWKREAAERQLINNIAQGSAAEIMKLAMIKIAKTAPQLGLLVQVYDELLFEASESEFEDALGWVELCMRTTIKLDVPLTVDCKIGPNWADCQ